MAAERKTVNEHACKPNRRRIEQIGLTDGLSTGSLGQAGVIFAFPQAMRFDRIPAQYGRETACTSKTYNSYG